MVGVWDGFMAELVRGISMGGCEAGGAEEGEEVGTSIMFLNRTSALGRA